MRGLLFEFLDPYANKFAKPLPIIGVRATLISNQKGQRLMGADDLWYPTMRKPPLASAPFD
jgi:hypothetical protein